MNKRQLAWEFMKQMDCFTVPEVANAVEMDLEQCRTTIKKLERQGFIKHIAGIGVPGKAKKYQVLTAANEPNLGKGCKPGTLIKRQGRTGQQLIWNALRINRTVVVSSVVAVSQCSPKSVSGYLRVLHKAGYLRCKKVDTRLPNHVIECHESIWTLIRETGPKAPLYRRGTGCWDQNEQKLYPFKSTEQSS